MIDTDYFFFTSLVYQYVRKIHHNHLLDPDYLEFCQQYNLTRNRTSAVIYAFSWIENNIQILIYRHIYRKNCMLDLTEQELADFAINYPLLNLELITEINLLESLTREKLNYLTYNQRLELLNMNI